MKILVAGCGSIGRRHLRNLKTLGFEELVGVDPREDRRRQVETELKVPTVGTLSQAFRDRADVVFVTAPSALHMPIALEAAKSGCHLFIEKPLSHNLEGADELIKEIESKKLVGFVGSNWKFHPSFQRMKTLLETGRIGRVTAARCQFGQYLPDWHPWEDFREGYSAKSASGGGVLLDSHEFDYLLWFLGGVSSVACFADRISSLPIETEDIASVLLRFVSGAIGHIHLDYIQRSYQRSCEFHGEEGSIRWDIKDRAVRLFEAKSQAWTVFEEPVAYDINQMYVDEIRHFLECIRLRVPPLTDFRQGVKCLKLILAAKKSQATGRAIDVN